MENIRFINSNVAVCRSDMPILTIGSPLLNRQIVDNALFELVSVKRWQHMVAYIDRWAPYGLPYYSSGGILWDRPLLKSKGKRNIAGDLSRVRKQVSIKDADLLQPILAQYEEHLAHARSVDGSMECSGYYDALSDEFDMKLRAVDDSIDQSSQVIGIEELLAHRDMLTLACRLFRGYLECDLSDELFALTEMRTLRDGRIQVGFSCERLFANDWIRKQHYGKMIGDRPATFLMAKMPAWEALSLDVDFAVEKNLMSFFAICPESVKDGEGAVRYAASVFASALVNENTIYSTDSDGGRYLDRELRLVSNADLIWQMWFRLGEMFSDRVPIGKCEQCRVPIPSNGGQLYCSDACKTAASKMRRDIALKYALTGRPLEDAVDAIGERFRPNVKRWYREAGRDA